MQIEDVKKLMQVTELIRNISVIAHVDHGKTTLSDCLIANSGLIDQSKAGNEQYMTTDSEGKNRGITIKSTGISLLHEQ